MPPKSHALPPVSLQKMMISGALNSTLLFVYLAGVSIGLYLLTLAIYLSPQSNRRHRIFVITCIIVLACALLGELCLQWYSMSISYVYFASTRLEMFAGKGAFSVAVPITAIIFVMLGQIVADGLMIWRSFHASGGSYSRVSPVFLLFIAEVGLCVTSITLNILYNLHPTLLTVKSARRYNVIEGSSSIVTASTSILATFIIGHRIYSSTSSDPRSRQRYARIIEIIVHSSAIYSTAMLAQAICNLINTGDSNRSSALIVVTNYLTTLSVATASIAPTLMVARLGLEQGKEVDESSITSLTLPEGVAMQVVNFSDSRNSNPSDA